MAVPRREVTAYLAGLCQAALKKADRMDTLARTMARAAARSGAEEGYWRMRCQLQEVPDALRQQEKEAVTEL